MGTSTATTRSRLLRASILVASGAAAVPVLAVPSATGTSDPCAASEVARTIGSVAKSTGDYLDSHPETNQAMTGALRQPAGTQSLGSVKSYFEAHPKVAADLTSIAQPITTLSSQCKLPITIPQALGVAQAAQGAGGLPNLPAGTPPLGNLPGVTLGGPPAGTGPLPSPAPRPNSAG